MVPNLALVSIFLLCLLFSVLPVAVCGSLLATKDLYRNVHLKFNWDWLKH